jgi:hypothetical protein
MKKIDKALSERRDNGVFSRLSLGKDQNVSCGDNSIAAPQSPPQLARV